MYFPAEGDRIVVTTGRTKYVGIATQIMPFGPDSDGVMIGGWRFTGTCDGREVVTAMSCPQSLALHHGVTMTVRPATDND